MAGQPLKKKFPRVYYGAHLILSLGVTGEGWCPWKKGKVFWLQAKGGGGVRNLHPKIQ